MEKSDIVDYAMPLINIERMVRETHDLCLAGKFDAAREVTLLLTTETRVLQATLAIMDAKCAK